MITFQLDQNVNRKDLARKCNMEGKAVVKRFPEAWKNHPNGFKDPELLEIVMVGQNPLVTNDRRIARDHVQFIPSANPGIIIVRKVVGDIVPWRKGEIEKVIHEFKQRFPQWCTVAWTNSIVEISRGSVEVFHVDSGQLARDAYFDLAEADWSGRLEEALLKNAGRHPPQSPLLADA